MHRSTGVGAPSKVMAEHQHISVLNQSRGTFLAQAADVADTSASRRTGLLRRQSLAPGEGLWIVPCESVHTFFMKFAIDLVYLDRSLRVRKVREKVPPWRVSACLPAYSVLELPAGIIAASGTRKGDQLVVENVSAP